MASIFRNMGYPCLGPNLMYQWADAIGFQASHLLVYILNALLAYLWIRRDDDPSLWWQ